MKNTHSPVVRRKDYTPPAFQIDRTELCFDLESERTLVEATLHLRRAVTGGNDPLILDGDADMDLLSVALDGHPLSTSAYRLEPEILTLPDVPDHFTLTLCSAINPAANTKLEGLYQSNALFCTQCEAHGFRRIVWYLDRPDVMAPFEVTLRADKAKYPVLLSNGNCVETADLPDGRHQAVWKDPFRKPSYLFALVAGDLTCVEDYFTTRSGREVALRFYVEHGYKDQCGWAMDSLKRSMKWDEDRFGLEYDLDVFNIVAVDDFNMGAMENKSLNIFNAKYILADPRIATDSDYEFVEKVVAHEYFHNWTGNRVTCRDWFQLSLKEGLTVFRDQEFSADMRSRAVQRIEDVQILRTRQFPEDAGPLAHPVRPDSYVEINNFYTPTVYEKGAEVIRMLHTLLGEEGFQKGMKLYFDRHDGQAVTCDDFVAAMSDANGVDLQLFKRWYEQAGTPEVAVQETYDVKARTLTLTLSQTTLPTPGQLNKRPLHILLRTALIGPDGDEMAVTLDGRTATEHVLEFTQAEQSFRFETVREKPVLSLNRGFSAPILIKSQQSHAEQLFLMTHDADPFNRWEAGQQYACALMLDKIRTGNHPGQEDFINALAPLTQNNGPDAAFCALALTLPSEDYLAECMEVVDVKAIHQVREDLRQAIGQTHYSAFENLYVDHGPNGPFRPEAAAAGRRALCNTALAYLCVSDRETAPSLLKAHYDQADNMTDTVVALRGLTHLMGPEREEAFAHFYSRWRHNPHVMDKWLALQAMSHRPDVLAQIRKLTENPVFTWRNPNKVRSLISGFSVGNPLRFHAKDGGGYDFLAEAVLEMDRLNPQTAARLLPPLGRWRQFDIERQEKMKAALNHILAEPTLSRDVYEVASKALGTEGRKLA